MYRTRSAPHGESVRPEYSVYVFHRPDDVQKGQSDWEKKRVTRSKYKAMRLAEKLHGSDSYSKVEIKKKAFDARYAKIIDRTLKIYSSQSFIPRPPLFAKLPKILRRLFVRR